MSSAFSSVSVSRLPAPSRLLVSACCPDKDLITLVTRLGTQERLSLWKNGGTKSWEVDITSGKRDGIIGLAWSPDGRSIAVAHRQFTVTVHSIQDGSEEWRISIENSSAAEQLSSVWWFKAKQSNKLDHVADAFQKGDIVTGSARSVLSTLPLLDRLQAESQKSTATDLFAFQGSRTQPEAATTIPDVITRWPAFAENPAAATMSTLPPGQISDPRVSVYDDSDGANVDSILAVIDDKGILSYFLDGTYPVGSTVCGVPLDPLSLYKNPERPVFYAHPQVRLQEQGTTGLLPTIVECSLLSRRCVRDMAILSTIVKDLSWYLLRLIQEMRSSWFGSPMTAAARELGPNWIRGLEGKLKDHNSEQRKLNALLDLTTLLLAGRPSEALSDFLGSAEQMSERGLQKWETTVTESLVKLRDFSEKRIALACQRIHLVLEEIQGWSQLSQFASFELQGQEIDTCLDLTNRTIVLAAWLASAARRELSRFKDFMLWVKFETEALAASNAGHDTHPVIQHDILEVNKYLMSGLVVSPIDKWFMGPMPHFSSRDLRASGTDHLPDAMKRATEVLDDPNQVVWQEHVRQNDLNHIDRNIDALVQELVSQCQRVFVRAASAVGRSSSVTPGPHSMASQVVDASPTNVLIRERTVFEDKNGDGEIVQYLAIASLSSEAPNTMCLTRVKHSGTIVSPISIGICLLECFIANEDGDRVEFEVLDAEFFDDENIIIVYRPREQDGAFLATVGYNDLGYEELGQDGDGKMRGRENLMADALSRWRKGPGQPEGIPIRRSRRLAGCGSGGVSLAVNGRAGRRVAVVVDGKGTTMEVIDMEGDEDDEEDEEENGNLDSEG